MKAALAHASPGAIPWFALAMLIVLSGGTMAYSVALLRRASWVMH